MIYELKDTSKVKKIFDGWNETLIYSCVQKVMGKIIVTDIDNPKSAVAFVGCFGFCAGEPEKELVSNKPAGLAILIPQNDAWAELIEVCFPTSKRVKRYAIKKNTIFNEEVLRKNVCLLPEGYELKKIDADVYDKCLDSPVSADFVSAFESKEKYLSIGRGIVITKNNKIVAGASSYTRYEEGIEIDSIGDVSGNGMMLNLQLFSDVTTEPLIEGNYQINESKMPFTVMPGEIKEQGETTYATGSFLGQYSDYGLSVLFAKTGLMKVTKEAEEYYVECVMEGELNEHIVARFRGNITIYRGDTTYKVEEIYYTKVELTDTLIENETMLQHTRAIFQCENNNVEMILRLPKSCKEQILEGRYTLSNKTESYTIMEGAKIGKTDIESGTLDITKNEKGIYVYSGSFKTANKAFKLTNGREK